jgi:hypothetical protein
MIGGNTEYDLFIGLNSDEEGEIADHQPFVEMAMGHQCEMSGPKAALP